MIVPIQTKNLHKFKVGTLFLDEASDIIPYRISKIEGTKVFCNSIVDKDSLLEVPMGQTVYISTDRNSIHA